MTTDIQAILDGMTDRRKARQEVRALLAQPAKRQKYRNERVLHDGMMFDSKAERNYYASLKLRERAGEVTDIDRQRSYDLIVNGVLIAKYVADVIFFDRTLCRWRVVDVKGAPVTREFKMKQRLMKSIHKIDVEVVRMK